MTSFFSRTCTFSSAVIFETEFCIEKRLCAIRTFTMKQTPNTNTLTHIVCTIGRLFFPHGVKHAIWSLKHAVITTTESFERFL